MRPLVITLLLSLFIVSGNSSAYADHRNNGHRDNHKEYSRPGNGNKYDKNREKQMKQRQKEEEKYWKAQQKREKQYYNHHTNHMPAPPRHPASSPYFDRQLHDMVCYAARGGRDVNVWRISHDTYIVKYYKGGRYYTQRLYPYTGRYGRRSQININWSPESPWTLLPSININIPL